MTKQIKRSLYLLTAVIAVIAIVLAVAPQFALAQAQGDIAPQADMSSYFSGGDGSASNPYLISNEAELKNIKQTYAYDDDEGCYCTTKSFKLLNNITIGYEVWSPIQGYFMGTIDGNNKAIFNIRISYLDDLNDCGFFEKNQGTIKNLIFNSAKMSNEKSTGVNFGVIAGTNSGTIANCQILNSSIDVSADSTNIGAVAGKNHGTIRDCKINNTSMTGNSYNANLGGIVGRGEYGMIAYCKNYAGITGRGNVGGIVGSSYNASINYCENEGTITYDRVKDDPNGCFGGIVGKAEHNTYIQKCINFGSIDYQGNNEGKSNILKPCMAQIVGWSVSAELDNCAITEGKTNFDGLYEGLFIHQKQYCSDGAIGREGQ